MLNHCCLILGTVVLHVWLAKQAYYVVPERYNSSLLKEDKQETKSSGCDDFLDNLELCKPFSCMFRHPFTGEMMKKEIIGLVDDKCSYTEEMPNNGRMNCEYTEDLRKAIVQYQRDIIGAGSIGTRVEADLGDEKVKTTYKVHDAQHV